MSSVDRNKPPSGVASPPALVARARALVDALCSFGPHRRTGSAPNRAAVQFAAEQAAPFGFEIDTEPFECLDHELTSVSLTCAGEPWQVFASPYTLGCDVEAELVCASTVEELRALDAAGKLLLMRGDLCREQLMPKGFVFYNPEAHQELYALLEDKAPAAILTATERDLQMVGDLYPFNVFEDGDFDIPSAYCTDRVGAALASHTGDHVHLVIDARRIPSSGANLLLRKRGSGARRVVVTAHVDTKETTPGATDNASGTAVLLLLAELLRGWHGALGVEIVAFNGEDDYSVAGQMDWLRRFGDSLTDIVLEMNIDDVGWREGGTACSFYGVPDELKAIVDRVLAGAPGIEVGEPWYQGDHMIFVQKNVPALAFSSTKIWELMKTVTHTARDVPEIVDPAQLAELALALRDLVERLDVREGATGG
jgi:aminopeptidase YwaD